MTCFLSVSTLRVPKHFTFTHDTAETHETSILLIVRNDMASKFFAAAHVMICPSSDTIRELKSRNRNIFAELTRLTLIGSRNNCRP
jgi:hypothetical protein